MSLKLTREMFYTEGTELYAKILSFEEERTKEYPLPLDTPLTLRDIPLKKMLAIGADDELVAAKVHDTVVRGAEEAENLWSKFCRVIDMDTEIERVPLITPDDYKFLPWARDTVPRGSGGSFFHVELDCSDDKGLNGVDVRISKNFVKRRGFDAVEEALWCVGQAAGRLVLQAVVAEYTADVNSAMTNAMANWGNSQYKALVKAESLIADQGMQPNVILINPAEGYDIGILDYFIREDYSRAATGIPADLNSIGSLYGRLPIYRSRDMTAASMVVANAQKSVIVGIMDGLAIENYDDIRKGMQGAIASLQFDIKNASDATGPGGATSPCAKAWAVITTA